MNKLSIKFSFNMLFYIINFILIVLTLYLLWGKDFGYVVILDNKPIGVINDKKMLNEYYEEKLHNNNSTSGNIVKVDSIQFLGKLVDKSQFLNEKDAQQLLDMNLNIYVEGYKLFLDGKYIANISDKNTFDEVKKRLTDYYIKQHNLEMVPINWTKIKEEVSFSEDIINLKYLFSEEDLYNYILSNNLNNNTIATVEIVATKTFLENNSGNTVQVKALSNQSNSGQDMNNNDFDREVVKEITYNNDKYIGMRKISTKILRPSLSEVQGNELFYLNNPSKSSVITSSYGLRWGGEKHHGIDIAGNIGDPIFAAESGFANLVSYNSIYGNYMKLNHGKGIETLYGHCDVMFIKEGEYVEKGQIIGKIGNTGRSTGPHLHFEVRVNGKADNPLNYVAY